MNDKFFDFTFEDENGKLKSKEEFLKQFDELYDSLAEAQESEGELKNVLIGEEYYKKLVQIENVLDLDMLYDSHNFYQRNIYINEEMNDELVQKIHQSIKFYNIIDTDKPVEDRIPINIYINSDGGNTDCCLSICSSIVNSKTPVYTWNIGRAYSSGFFILLCGHKRFGVKYGQYLFHLGHIGMQGDSHKFLDFSEYFTTYLDTLKSLVLEHSNMDEKTFDSLIKDDWWFDSEEALKNGFIDEIVTTI